MNEKNVNERMDVIVSRMVKENPSFSPSSALLLVKRGLNTWQKSPELVVQPGRGLVGPAAGSPQHGARE